MSGPGGNTEPGGPIGSLSTDMDSNAQRQQLSQQLTSPNQMLYQQQEQLAMRQKLQQQQQQQQQSLLKHIEMELSSAIARESGKMLAAASSGMQQSQQQQEHYLGMPQVMNQASVSRQQEQQPLLQGSPNVPTALTGGGATRPSISNNNPMSGPGGTSEPGEPTGILSTDMYSNAGKQLQQLTSQNQMLYQQQQLAICQKLLQQTEMQMSSALTGASGMMSAVPMSEIHRYTVQQQPVGQVGSFQQQALMRQQPQVTVQNPTITLQQTNNVTDLQQQLLQMMQQQQMRQNQLQQNQMRQRQPALVQESQPQQQQHLLPQLQSQQQKLPQQLTSMVQKREMQLWMQGSSALLQMQNNNTVDSQRQQQFIPEEQQLQRVLQDVASSPASTDSTAQTGHPGDWQVEVYQKLKSLKDTYCADLREIHQKLSIKLNQLDNRTAPNAKGEEEIEKMKHFKVVLEHMMTTLSLSKDNLHIGLKVKLPIYEKEILRILRKHKKVPQQQPQAGASSDQPHFPPLQHSQPGMKSQQSSQQKQSLNNHTNQIQQQLKSSALTQSNSLSMPNSLQSGMQNTLQQHLLSQLQLEQQQLQQQQQISMIQQREMQMPQQQQMQGSSALLQTQNNPAIDSQRQQQHIPQQKLPQQQQRVLQNVVTSPALRDSTAQTCHPEDSQEEMYQKLKSLKDTYFVDLSDIHQKVSIKLCQLDSTVPPNARGDQIEKLKHFKVVVERMMIVLSTDKHNLQTGLKDKLPLYEKQILSIVQYHKKVPQQQPHEGVRSDQPQLPSLQQPAMQSQQPQQMDNHTNLLQQQSKTSALTRSNSLSSALTGSQAAIGSDLVGMTKRHLALNVVHPDVPPTKKMKI